MVHTPIYDELCRLLLADKPEREGGNAEESTSGAASEARRAPRADLDTEYADTAEGSVAVE